MSDEPISPQTGPYQGELLEGRPICGAAAGAPASSPSATARTRLPALNLFASLPPRAVRSTCAAARPPTTDPTATAPTTCFERPRGCRCLAGARRPETTAGRQQQGDA